MTTTNSDSKKDEALWEIAKRRASFKWNLISYFIINCFLIVLWFITSGKGGGYFWPIWPMLGWGIGLAFHYFGAYHATNIFSVEEEYKKLKNQQ